MTGGTGHGNHLKVLLDKRSSFPGHGAMWLVLASCGSVAVMASPVGIPFLDHFAALRDPRQAWKVVFPLPEEPLVVLCGTLAGAEDFVDIRRWARLHLDFLRRFLPFARGIPNHDTLNDILNDIDAELFTACFSEWVTSLCADTSQDGAGPEIVAPEIVAIDGKTSRRIHDKAAGRNPLHLVSAWATSQRLVRGQQACEAKSNEITAIPLPLDRLALRGAPVTIDSMGCQTKIAQKVLNREADYLLAVKENWPNLHAEIARAFDDPATTGLLRHETTDADHGSVERRRSPGIEVRRHAVSHDVDFLQTNRFPGLQAIAMVEAEVGRGDKTTLERRFYLSSLALDATLFAHAVRSHWHIENRLHWVLDVVFHEDLSRLRSGHGPQNMATVRHIALSLLPGAKDKHSLKTRRKSAGWNTDYLEAIIRRTA